MSTTTTTTTTNLLLVQLQRPTKSMAAFITGAIAGARWPASLKCRRVCRCSTAWFISFSRMVAPCCNKECATLRHLVVASASHVSPRYWCRHCHNEAEETVAAMRTIPPTAHTIDRYAVKEVSSKPALQLCALPDMRAQGCLRSLQHTATFIQPVYRVRHTVRSALFVLPCLCLALHLLCLKFAQASTSVLFATSGTIAPKKSGTCCRCLSCLWRSRFVTRAPRSYYHCHGCGICRVGGQEECVLSHLPCCPLLQHPRYCFKPILACRQVCSLRRMRPLHQPQEPGRWHACAQTRQVF